jgi:hypothetical protein
LDQTCAQREVELAGLKVNREHQIRQLHDLVLRFSSGMRSYFGADSPQYEQAGGTRASARKPSAHAESAARHIGYRVTTQTGCESTKAHNPFARRSDLEGPPHAQTSDPRIQRLQHTPKRWTKIIAPSLIVDAEYGGRIEDIEEIDNALDFAPVLSQSHAL